MSNRTILVISGIILIAGGVLALLLPVAASLAATLIVGWAFIIAGGVHIVAAFREAEHRLWTGGFGVVEVILGLSFLFNPLGGMISLALFLGILFLASGIMQLYLAWKRRDRDSVWMLAISGVISLALAVFVAADLMSAAAFLPGILFGIEMLSTGIAFLMLRPHDWQEVLGGGDDQRVP